LSLTNAGSMVYTWERLVPGPSLLSAHYKSQGTPVLQHLQEHMQALKSGKLSRSMEKHGMHAHGAGTQIKAQGCQIAGCEQGAGVCSVDRALIDLQECKTEGNHCGFCVASGAKIEVSVLRPVRRLSCAIAQVCKTTSGPGHTRRYCCKPCALDRNISSRGPRHPCTWKQGIGGRAELPHAGEQRHWGVFLGSCSHGAAMVLFSGQ
jgi:hypothetical protein